MADQSYPPFQQKITERAGQIDNPAWRMFFVWIATSLQNLTNGTVTHTGGLTLNQLVIGNGAADLKTLGTLGTTTTVLHGNAAGAPTFGAVSLTTDVTGTLPATNGGTGTATVAQGDLLYGSAANVWSKLAKNTTATRYLANTGASNNPNWDQVNLANGVTGTLTVSNGGTGIATLTANRVPYGNGTSAFQSAANFTFDGTTFTTAGQVAFPATQNPSSDANTLDDYEEGTWTPVLGGSGGTSGQTYTVQLGEYVKIGKLVRADFNVKFSNAGTITTDLEIQGLPFTIENTTNYRPTLSVGSWTALNTAVVWLSGIGVANTTKATIQALTAAGTGTATLTSADVTNTTQISGSIEYRATA
jgi:hypothetical protein